MGMNKEEIIDMMVESITADNRDLCKQNNMSDEEAEAQISKVHPTLVYMASNIYTKLKDGGALA